MQITRMAQITGIFIEEGLGFLTASREAADTSSSSEQPALEGPPVTVGDDTDDEAPQGGTDIAKREANDAEIAMRLRRTLERLGPTFVKFGQLLATRVDLFSESFISELAKLHSDVTPYPTEEAREIIEADLGQKIEDVFEDFPQAPVAAASIAQVYKARLRARGEHEHGWVALKVQRPNLEQTLLRDLDALLSISGLIDRLVPRYRRAMVHKVAKEYVQRARSELDFLAEARAIERFSDVLQSAVEFRIPAVHHDLCTPRVLTMEWLDGTKLDTVPSSNQLSALGFEPEMFCRSMLKLQVSMAYEHGFVHGDTHPGNIILLQTGHIGLIDFGLHGHVPRTLRDKMLEMIFYQSSGRHDEAIEAFVAVFRPDPASDIDSFRREMRSLLEADAGTRALADNRITEQLIRGMRVGSRYRLEAQSELLIVLRNLTIVEGIVLRYSPTLDPNEELRTIVADIMRRKVFGRSMREEMTQLLPQVLLTLSQRPRLAERLLQLERNFIASKSLGHFLRQETVLHEAPKRRLSGWVVAVVAVVGAIGGWLLRGAF